MVANHGGQAQETAEDTVWSSTVSETQQNQDPPAVSSRRYQSLPERISELREKGDVEGVAKEVIDSFWSRRERKELNLTPEELRVFGRLKREHKANRAHREAYAYLRELRAEGNIFQMARLVTYGSQTYRDVVSGQRLPRGVAQFVLTADEVEAIRNWAGRPHNSAGPLVWELLRRGLYQTTDGVWTIKLCGFNQWVLYEDSKGITLERCGRYGPFSEVVKFDSVWDAKFWAEEYGLPNRMTRESERKAPATQRSESTP